MPDATELLTTPQVAERLGMHPGAVRRLVSDGKLQPAIERWRGRLLLFAPEEVARYERERRPVGNPAIGELRRKREVSQTSQTDPQTP